MTLPTPIPSRQWQPSLNGISNLTLVQTFIPLTALGEILVRINAVSLNFKDGKTIEGQLKHHKAISLPEAIVPCSDAAGEVWEAGEGVTRWKKGDRVLASPYPEIFKEDAVLAAPTSMSDEEACTLAVAGITAWMSMNGQRLLGSLGGEGEAVLIQGMGGDLGADYTINCKITPDWDVEALRLTSRKGADIIFENNGAMTTAKSFNCIRFGRLFNAIGYVSGKDDAEEERLNINVQAVRRNVILVDLLNKSRDRVEEMCRFYEKGIRPVVDRVFKFEEAKEALHYMWRGSHFGKAVVKVH
ncbi:quinone reductase [Acephala macrosclerotiorum]|nr:quinone reductase [Acephala macrosclerotiorum]